MTTFTMPKTATYTVGQLLIRAEVFHAGVEYVEFRVDAVTARGCWIKDVHMLQMPTVGQKNPRGRWVSARSAKRFAYPTRAEARDSLIARKRAYVRNCQGRLKRAEEQLHEATNGAEGLARPATLQGWSP